MPWISDDEYNKIKDRKKCSKCGSTNLRFKEQVKYCDPNDCNPNLYECQDCGNITTFWE